MNFPVSLLILYVKHVWNQLNFHQNWKKLSLTRFVKREKETFKNYRPVSLLSICAKIFERIIFNMIEYFIENNLISPNLLGFRPGDSITQLLFIVMKSYGHLISDFQLQRYFWTFQKLLIEFKTKLLFSNCVKMVFMVIWLTF